MKASCNKVFFFFSSCYKKLHCAFKMQKMHRVIWVSFFLFGISCHLSHGMSVSVVPRQRRSHSQGQRLLRPSRCVAVAFTVALLSSTSCSYQVAAAVPPVLVEYAVESSRTVDVTVADRSILGIDNNLLGSSSFFLSSDQDTISNEKIEEVTDPEDSAGKQFGKFFFLAYIVFSLLAGVKGILDGWRPTFMQNNE